MLRNVGHQVPSDAVPHCRRTEISIIPLWEPKNLYCFLPSSSNIVGGETGGAAEDSNMLGENGEMETALGFWRYRLLDLVPYILLAVYRRFRETCRSNSRVIRHTCTGWTRSHSIPMHLTTKPFAILFLTLLTDLVYYKEVTSVGTVAHTQIYSIWEGLMLKI
jgi:hypothetical protein